VDVPPTLERCLSFLIVSLQKSSGGINTNRTQHSLSLPQDISTQLGAITPNLTTATQLSPMSDIDLCHSVSDSGDGCGGIFPLKTSAGLCAKCQKLATLELDSPEYSSWKVCFGTVFHFQNLSKLNQNMHQCSSCGVAWRNRTPNSAVDVPPTLMERRS
jgi:hypothetical protein